MLYDMTLVDGMLSELVPLTIESVNAKYDLVDFKSYIEQYHYRGYDRSIGENMKYFVYD